MKQRDLELLSSYLDGQLKPSDSARLEARLSSDPDLRSVFEDLRSARGLLRQLPMRKAPRNFTLTPKMVGKNPPLPRTYPAFKFVTALAAVLLFFSLGANFLVPQIASSPLAYGKGGGGAPDVFSAQAPAAAATEAPATQAPAAEAPAEQPSDGLAPLPTPTPSLELAPAPTTIAPPVQNTAPLAETPMEKVLPGQAESDRNLVPPNLPQPKVQPPVPPMWEVVLTGIVLVGAVVMLLMRRLAAERWRQK